MMLDWLADRHGLPECAEAGRRIDTAVARVLAEGRFRPEDRGVGTVMTLFDREDE